MKTIRIVQGYRLTKKRLAQIQQFAETVSDLSGMELIPDGAPARGNRYCFAYAGEELVGFLTALSDGEVRLAVSETYRRKGIATRLLQETGLAQMHLQANVNQKAFRGFMEALGGRRQGSDYLFCYGEEKTPANERKQKPLNGSRQTELKDGAKVTLYLEPMEGFEESPQPQGYLDLVYEHDAVAGLQYVEQKQVIFVYHVYVQEGFRRRGMAETMLAYLIEKRKGRALLLHTDSSNVPAVNLYRKLGFWIKEEIVTYELCNINKIR